MFYFNSYTSYLFQKKSTNKYTFLGSRLRQVAVKGLVVCLRPTLKSKKLWNKLENIMSFHIPHVGFPSRQTFSPFRGLFQNSRGSKFIATGWLLGSSLMRGIASGFYVWITGIKDRHIGDLKCIKMYSKWSNDSLTSWIILEPFF